MRLFCLSSLLVVSISASIAAQAGAAPLRTRWEDAPASAKLLDRRIPKDRAAYLHDVHLTLRNRHREPIWLVLRGHPDQPLDHEGCFEKLNSGKPFVKKLHEGTPANVIELYFFAQNGFTAFYLAPGARIDLAHFPLIAFEHVHEIEVWEVRDLKVNGVTSLADWLPIDVRCEHSTFIASSLETKWEGLCREPQQTGETIGAIHADVLRRWVLPLRK